MPLLKTPSTSFVVSGEEFPVLRWSATLANAGAMGTFTASGCLSDLIASGLDLVAASQNTDGASVDIYGSLTGGSNLVFSGICDTVDFDWDADTFEIHGRDHAAALANGKQTLAGKNVKNQSVAEIVRQIAQQFGFTPDIVDPGVQAGPLMGGENSYNPQPQTYWALLQSLAENTGSEVWITPDRTLRFAPEPDQPNGAFDLNYAAGPNTDVDNPCWGLKVTYNPFNNTNIVVRAISYDVQKCQRVTTAATAQPTQFGKGRKTKSSLLGLNQKSAFPTAGGSGSKGSAKTIHYIRCPGMTPDQAQLRCQSQADQLAKRQLIITANTELLTDLKIHSEVTLIENTIDLYGFGEVAVNIAEVTHNFDFPESDESGGLTTTFRGIAQVEQV